MLGRRGDNKATAVTVSVLTTGGKLALYRIQLNKSTVVSVKLRLMRCRTLVEAVRGETNGRKLATKRVNISGRFADRVFYTGKKDTFCCCATPKKEWQTEISESESPIVTG